MEKLGLLRLVPISMGTYYLELPHYEILGISQSCIGFLGVMNPFAFNAFKILHIHTAGGSNSMSHTLLFLAQI